MPIGNIDANGGPRAHLGIQLGSGPGPLIYPGEPQRINAVLDGPPKKVNWPQCWIAKHRSASFIFGVPGARGPVMAFAASQAQVYQSKMMSNPGYISSPWNSATRASITLSVLLARSSHLLGACFFDKPNVDRLIKRQLFPDCLLRHANRIRGNATVGLLFFWREAFLIPEGFGVVIVPAFASRETRISGLLADTAATNVDIYCTQHAGIDDIDAARCCACLRGVDANGFWCCRSTRLPNRVAIRGSELTGGPSPVALD